MASARAAAVSVSFPAAGDVHSVGDVRLRRALARLVDGPPALCLADPLDR